MIHHERSRMMAVVGQIESLFDELKQQIGLINESLKNSNALHTKEDFISLKKSLKKMRDLLDRFYQTLELEADPNAQSLTRLRLELRSVVSKIIGVSELIADSVNKSPSRNLLTDSIAHAVTLSQRLLRLIDMLNDKELQQKKPPPEKRSADKEPSDKRAENVLKELDEAKQILITAIESMEEGFAFFDASDKLSSFNQQFYDLYPAVESLGSGGFTYEEFLRENWRLGVYQEERRKDPQPILPTLNEGEREKWIARYLGYHRNPQQPYHLLLNSGTWIEVSEHKILGGGTVTVHKDITRDKQKEQQLRYLEHHDPLTGLVNRGFFEKRVHEMMTQSDKNKASFALLFLDVDDFREINDTFGHDFGDYMLANAAQKFKTTMRGEDLVGRIGGDQFATVIESVTDQNRIEEVTQRCLDSINMTIERDGQLTTFSVCAGVAFYPDAGASLKTLFKNVEEALTAAKNAGKGSYRIFKR
jgi:diguanylate cyclase (GGDEF)-like protein